MRDAASTVLIVDDDISIRESLEHLLASVGHRVESYASAEPLLQRPPSSGPICLILDLNLPDLNGLEAQALIANNRAEMPIIFMSGDGDIPSTVRAMKGGATEFFTKPFEVEALLKAVDEAIARSSAVLAHESNLSDARFRYSSLSPREKQVMQLVVSGLLNKQVAFRLGISEITVKAHRGKVMRKMKASSLAALIGLATALHPDTIRMP